MTARKSSASNCSPPVEKLIPSYKPTIPETRQLVMNELIHSPQHKRKLSANASFTEKFVDKLSQREVFNKHLYRPNTYLHKWWARRCGSTFRAILKQFVDDEKQRDYYSPGGLEGRIVLDPMMGGGTTLHEAIRLGANVIGADIDPIPIVQARAALTASSLASLQSAFNHFFSSIHNKLGHYFQTECPSCQKTVDIRHTLYGVKKICACGETIQIDQYDLRREAGRIIRICPQSGKILNGPTKPIPPLKTTRLITKPEKRCAVCGQEYAELLDLPFYARYMPIAIVADCPDHGMFFRSPGKIDQERIQQAEKQRPKLDFGSLDDFKVKDGPKSGDLLKRNIHSYLDVFSSRQLLYLHQAIRQLREHEYGKAERLNIGVLVSTSLEFNSMLCGYKGWYKKRPGAIRHVFAMHAYSFQYTALENNPIRLEKSSGNLQSLFRDRIERGRKWAALPIERKIGSDGQSKLVQIFGEEDYGVEVFNQAHLAASKRKFRLIHGDSQRLPVNNHSVDLIVTDPPYYDSVQYSDLAAFFRVWLTRLLPNEAEWTYDESRCAVTSKKSASSSNFVTALSGIFAECGRVLKQHTGRMAFTFHHWDPAAWAELTIALKSSEFKLIHVSVVCSEHPISVHIRNLNSIKHDSILFLALDNKSSKVSWMPLKTIDTKDSETFCRQCGLALSWLLDSKFSPKEIRTIWNNLIQRKSHANYLRQSTGGSFWMPYRQSIRDCAKHSREALVSIPKPPLRQKEPVNRLPFRRLLCGT